MADPSADVLLTFWQDIWASGRFERAPDLIAPDVIAHDPGLRDPARGLAAYLGTVGAFRAALGNLQLAVDDLLTDEDRVVLRWTITGVHHGELLGLAPTQRPVMVRGMTFARLAQGRLIESWTNWDRFGVIRQLSGGEA